jgi:hypothetical protein
LFTEISLAADCTPEHTVTGKSLLCYVKRHTLTMVTVSRIVIV